MQIALTEIKSDPGLVKYEETVLEGGILHFVGLDLSVCDSPNAELPKAKVKNQLQSYYTHLDKLVRDAKIMRKAFIDTLDPNQQHVYKYLTKLMSFHYDNYREVLNHRSLIALLDKIHQNDVKDLMLLHQNNQELAQLLWKKGPLRKESEVLKGLRDGYFHILTGIKRKEAPITGAAVVPLWEHIQTKSDQVSDPVHQRIIKYVFGPTLWLHAHYLDHLQNIYYLLKIQFKDDFKVRENCFKYFCFLQDQYGILNAMLVNKNLQYPEHQEHVMIHHNIQRKMFGNVQVKMPSMLLHSYGANLFSSTREIASFPLAVMYQIFQKCHEDGLIIMETRQKPKFPEIPMGFFYQPLIFIQNTIKFRRFYRYQCGKQDD